MKFNADIELTTVKKGRKVIGYEMVIRDRRKPTTADIIAVAEKTSHQTDIYDFL